MRPRRRRTLRRRAAAAVLATAAALQRLADRVAGTATYEVPRPPHLADAPEHWLRMVAAYAPGLLRPPGAVEAAQPAPGRPAPLPARQPGRVAAPRAEQRPEQARRGHATPADLRSALDRAPLAMPSRQHATTTVPAVAVPGEAAPTEAVATPRRATKPGIAAIRAHPAAPPPPAVPTAERSRRTELPRVRPAESAATLPSVSPVGATPTWAVTQRAPQPAPVPVPIAPYPELPPRTSISRYGPGGADAPREPGSSRSHPAAARIRPDSAPLRTPEQPVPVTSRWPELPPAAPAGTARLQRRLEDWRADLVRIQEVG